MNEPTALESLELDGRRVFIRIDLDTTGLANEAQVLALRIASALGTVRYAQERGARVILGSHRGQPAGVDAKLSLADPGGFLAEALGCDVYLPEDVVGDSARKVLYDLRNKQICLLENLGFEAGEFRNDENFAKRLADLADIYVNEAVTLADRKFASLVLLPRFARSRAMGQHFVAQLRGIRELVTQSARGRVSFIGASVLTDQAHESALLLASNSHSLLVSGALASAVDRASSNVGPSADFTAEQLAQCRTLVQKCHEKNTELILLTADHGKPTVAALERALQRISTAQQVAFFGDLELDRQAPEATQNLLKAAVDSSAFTALVGDTAILGAQQHGPLELLRFRLVTSAERVAMKSILSEPLAAVQALDPRLDPSQLTLAKDGPNSEPPDSRGRAQSSSGPAPRGPAPRGPQTRGPKTRGQR